jgi:hypothetical protein
MKINTTTDSSTPDPVRDAIIATTRKWLEKVVIGLNLCPFANAVHTKGQIRYVVSEATSPTELVDDLLRELEVLAEASPEKIETTLLIHPYVLNDFLDSNDFMDVADAVLEDRDLIGEIQIAAFHPQYQFADSEPDAIDNYTNRSPFPTLHLLREESVERAVESMPDASEIYERNIATLRKLGIEGWDKLADDIPDGV